MNEIEPIIEIEDRRIGPHWMDAVGYHPAQWIFAILLFLFPLYIEFIISFTPIIPALRSVESFFVDTLHIGPNLAISFSRVGFVWLVLVVVWSVVVFRHKSYILTSQALIINRGVLTQTSDTLRYELIYECDIRRVIGERMLGLGTLIIYPISFHSGHPTARFEIGFVNDPENIRSVILSRATKLKAIGTL